MAPMRQLILMRHAKTERSNPGGDHARLLTDRGQADARLIAGWLRDKGLAPAMVLVSDAARTRQTVAGLASALAPGAETVFSNKLYLAAPETILHEIWSAPDSAATLLVIGHNPGMHELAFTLAQKGPRNMRDLIAGYFPTGATAVFAFETGGWADVMPGRGAMTGFVAPKALREAAAGGGDAG